MSNDLILSEFDELALISHLDDNPDLPLPLQQGLTLATQQLQNFAQSPDFSSKVKIAFGDNTDLTEFKAAWAAGDFSDLPKIEVRSAADINGANGAYAAAFDTIYISQEFLSQNAGDVEAVASLLVEEIGHGVDVRVNAEDSPGDEGVIFSALARDDTLSDEQLALLRAEDDTATVILDGQVVEIEQNSEPYLVKDVYPGSSEGLRSTIFGENINNTLYFIGNDGINGLGLWKSDGTTEGTTLIYSDVDNNFYPYLQYPGVGGSFVTNVNGTLFFRADDNIHGSELWKSDGTAEGTVLIKDINPGIGYGNADPRSPTEFNGTVYFSANDGIHGYELWKSDGTEEGTVLVKDINPGSNSGHFYDLTEFNGHLYFDGNDGTGTKLWRTDGTAEGTVPFADLYQIPEMIESNGTLYFRALDDPAIGGPHLYGYELWKTDGTEEGTILVKDINPGTNSSSPGYLTDVNGTLFFRARDEIHGYELWKSDGTEEGTVLVKDINPGSNGSNAYPIAAINNTLLFSADDGEHGYELWKTDGTEEGTVLVKDINLGGNSTIYPGIDRKAIVNVNDTLFFQINDGTHGAELWQTDGTAEGTVLVQDLNPGSNSSYAHPITVIDDTLLFMGNDGVHGQELWALNLSTNSNPVAQEDSYTTPERTALTIDAPGVLSNDSDPDDDILSVSDFDAISAFGGTVAVNPDGSFTYTPEETFAGIDRFSYTVSDDRGGNDTADVEIAVTTQNQRGIEIDSLTGGLLDNSTISGYFDISNASDDPGLNVQLETLGMTYDRKEGEDGKGKWIDVPLEEYNTVFWIDSNRNGILDGGEELLPDLDPATTDILETNIVFGSDISVGYQSNFVDDVEVPNPLRASVSVEVFERDKVFGFTESFDF